MSDSEKYSDHNFPDYNKITYMRCFLCDEFLSEPLSTDHVIPRVLFHDDATQRPTLKVHDACNNTKSLDDKWLAKVILWRSQHNPAAAELLHRFLDRAGEEVQRPQEFEWMENPTADYKLAKTFVGGMSFSEPEGGSVTGSLTPEAQDRELSAIREVAKGLGVRNLGFVKIAATEVITTQYEALREKGQLATYLNDVDNLVLDDRGEHCMQEWRGNLRYVLNPSGVLFLEFWGEVGYLVNLEIEWPEVYVKS